MVSPVDVHLLRGVGVVVVVVFDVSYELFFGGWLMRADYSEVYWVVGGGVFAGGFRFEIVVFWNSVDCCR